MAIAGTGLVLAAHSGRAASRDAPASGAKASVPVAAAAAGHGRGNAVKPVFSPPPESAIPDDAFGTMVREGERIFTHTRQYAGQYVGNDLDCGSCHLDAGRRADAMPLWGAWGMYPAYRRKNGHVNTFAERLQDCFRFSMNGKAPPADSGVIVALSSYAYWLARGAPTGMKLVGAGYLDLRAPAQTPDYRRGEAVYGRDCALCHGADGSGQKAAGVFVFPPLWGPGAFNWGAGLQDVNTAAGFIKANMPFSRGGTLNNQDAWDVAYFMDAHERPQDPRFTGNVAATRKQFHDNKWSLYGIQVNGHRLGSGAPGKNPSRSAAQ
ncbi:MAG: c-type cytochrome [Xanthomonadaceae bacterium]|nr:c-type cytochrome [Xanthomonadaceae bacterium]MDE2256918.1 c-type cytochrome [Xanthomonadaceae bacterium]